MGGEGGVEDWQHQRDGAEEGEGNEYGFKVVHWESSVNLIPKDLGITNSL